uniref:Uncharacterized protein n=2 Tax=Magallana gigas TaxID=29159 RepID=K1QPR1_MAGGI
MQKNPSGSSTYPSPSAPPPSQMAPNQTPQMVPPPAPQPAYGPPPYYAAPYGYGPPPPPQTVVVPPTTVYVDGHHGYRHHGIGHIDLGHHGFGHGFGLSQWVWTTQDQCRPPRPFTRLHPTSRTPRQRVLHRMPRPHMACSHSHTAPIPTDPLLLQRTEPILTLRHHLSSRTVRTDRHRPHPHSRWHPYPRQSF